MVDNLHAGKNETVDELVNTKQQLKLQTIRLKGLTHVMLNNKKKDMTPFDMARKPVKQYPFLLPLIWGASYLMTRKFGLKITKKNMKGIKPPFLVISTHQGFSDYYIAPLALFPYRANYVSDMEGFAAFGEWLYRGIGCIGKPRYVPDYSVVKNIKLVLDGGQSVVVFPESRHSNVGTTSYIPKNLGKLAKMMRVPIVTLSAHGSYLANPFWDEEHTRKTKMEAVFECIYTKEQAMSAEEAEIQKKIEEKMSYDEYAWQSEQQICIDYPKRAEGLHKVLFLCRNCRTAFQMASEGSQLSCTACGTVWDMNPCGQLTYGEKRHDIHIPDWYEWERKEIEQELLTKGVEKEYDVRVESLPNAKGFVALGQGTLKLDASGFELMIADRTMLFPHACRESVQTEYQYRGRGACIVLSDKDCCYYVYSDDIGFNPTRMQFIGEYYYQKSKSLNEI